MNYGKIDVSKTSPAISGYQDTTFTPVKNVTKNYVLQRYFMAYDHTGKSKRSG